MTWTSSVSWVPLSEASCWLPQIGVFCRALTGTNLFICRASIVGGRIECGCVLIHSPLLPWRIIRTYSSIVVLVLMRYDMLLPWICYNGVRGIYFGGWTWRHCFLNLWTKDDTRWLQGACPSCSCRELSCGSLQLFVFVLGCAFNSALTHLVYRCSAEIDCFFVGTAPCWFPYGVAVHALVEFFVPEARGGWSTGRG